MTQSFAAAPADRIYTDGPELLAARAQAIVAGPVAAPVTNVTLRSDPPGPDAVALRWTLSGTVDPATALKGTAPAAVPFVRSEQSLLLPDGGGRSDWERALGDWRPGDRMVVFIGAAPAAGSDRSAFPSGSGERDLAALLREIVALQSRPAAAAPAAWLAYATQAPQEAGRKAALRVLLQAGTGWPDLVQALDAQMSDPASSPDLRRYAYGSAVFGLTRGQWAADALPVADWLCRRFAAETEPRQQLAQLLALKLALRHAAEDATRAARAPLRQRLVDCLKRREPALAADPDLAAQYRQLRAAHADLF